MPKFFEPLTNPLITQFREDKFINKVLDETTESVKNELKYLAYNYVGTTIKKRINDSTSTSTLNDLKRNPEAIWSVLVLYGVLTGKPLQNGIYEVFIPNKSLQYFLVEKIVTWEKSRASSSQPLPIQNEPEEIGSFQYK